MAITITPEQRDAIYEEILTELSGSGDIWKAIEAGDYDQARRTRRRPRTRCGCSMTSAGSPSSPNWSYLS